MCQETYNLWSFIIQLISIVILAVYTIFTAKMYRSIAQQSNELRRQIGLSIIPAFTCEFTDKGNGDVHNHKFDWRIINIGSGLATDIRVSPLEIEPDEKFNVGKFNEGLLRYRSVTHLKPQDSASIDVIEFYKDKPVEYNTQSFSHYFDYQIRKGKNFSLVVNFRDIEGEEYEQNLIIRIKDRTSFECIPEKVFKIRQAVKNNRTK